MKKEIPLVDTREEQLEEWLKGNSVHLRIQGSKYVEYECCPDFSCCQPKLLADKKIREQYVISDQRGRNKFLGIFLGAAVAMSSDKKVHIAGQDEENN